MARPTRRLLLAPSLASLCLALTACGDSAPAAEESAPTTSSNGPTFDLPPPVPDAVPEVQLDSDQDGLDDDSERALGTSILLGDTDGDGYSDYEELVDYNFRADARDAARPGNPYRFNPLLADVPRLSIDVTSAPRVYLVYTTSDSEGTTFDNSSSAEESVGFTTTTGGGGSVRNELSATVGSEISATVGVNAGTTASINSSVTSSLALESSFNWSRTQSRDNRRTLSESRGFSRSSEVANTGARVEVVVDIENVGSMTCTIETVVLAMTKWVEREGRAVEVGQLEPESDRVFKDVGSLIPGERMEGVVFRVEVPLEKAEELLEDGPMTVRTLSVELLDQRGDKFDHRFTQVARRTATVHVDRGPEQVPETYFVAIHTEDGEGPTVLDALRGPLWLEPRLGTALWNYADGARETQPGLLALGDTQLDARRGGYWTVRLDTETGRGERTQIWDPHTAGVDLEQIRLTQDDTLRLMYVVDGDGDGLGLRAEGALGTDPEDADTDGDGVDDAEELRLGRNPLLGRARAEVVDVRSSDLRLTATLDVLPAESGTLDGVRVDWGDGSPQDWIEAPFPSNWELVHDYPTYGTYTIGVEALEEAQAVVFAGAARTVRVRLSPPLAEAWRVALEPGTMGPMLARAHPRSSADDVVLRTILRESQGRPGGSDRYVPHLVRFSPEGERLWDVELADGARDSLLYAGLGSSTVARGPDGRIYALTGEHVHAFHANGERIWQLRPDESGAELELGGLAVDERGRVFVTGRRKRAGVFLARIDAGATLAYVRDLEGLRSAPLVVERRPRGGMLLADVESVRMVDASGEVTRRYDHGHGALKGAFVDRDDAVVFSGIATSTGRDAEGNKSVTILPGLWRHDASGEVRWGFVAPVASSPPLYGRLAVDAEGEIYVPTLVPSQLPDGTFDNHLALQGFRADGSRSMGLRLAPLPDEVGFSAMVLPLPVGISPSGESVDVAWTAFDLPPADAPEGAVGSSHVELVRLRPNPSATALLED